MLKFSPHITIYDFKESEDIQNEIIWLFSKNLSGVASIKNRLNIHIVRTKTEERAQLKGNIKSIWKYITIKDFLIESQYERKLKLLTFLTNCFIEVSEQLKWDVDKIKEAKKRSIIQKLSFNYLSNSKLNKSKSLSASIELSLTKNKVSIWVVFNDEKMIIKKHLIDTYSHQVAFFRQFEKAKWFDNESFGFEFNNGMTLRVSPQNEKVVWSKSSDQMEEYFLNNIIYKEELNV